MESSMEQESKMNTDNMNVHGEDELTGGDTDKRLPCGCLESKDCDCRQIADEQKEEQLRDGELFKEK